MEGDSSHVYAIPTDFLYRNSYDPVLVDDTLRNPPPLTTPIPSLNYSDIVSGDEGLHSWLSLLAERGLVLVKNVPTELGMVVKVSELIAPVQETSFGRMFDVLSSDYAALNISYTSSELELHMDVPHYESPPGLQLLHCVRFDPCVSGGESTFVDGFEVARKFKETDPEDFKILSSVPATFQKVHYIRDQLAHLICSKPHITTNTAGDIVELVWAPIVEGPLRVHPDLVEPYYRARHKFSQAVHSLDNVIEHRLQPGELVSFNNRRILHGRRGFSLNGGVRHIQGAYISIDEFSSKYLYQSIKTGKHHTRFHVGNGNIYRFN
jgi:gamma-butyrobetaine dioxygenase